MYLTVLYIVGFSYYSILLHDADNYFSKYAFYLKTELYEYIVQVD